MYARSYVRYTYRGGTISGRRALRRRAKLVFNSLLWPAFLVMSALRHTGEFGTPVKARSGKGVLRQFWEQLHLGLMHSVPPRSYYWFRIFEESNRRRARQFLHYHENNYLLAAAGRMDDQRRIRHKEEFTEWCRRLDLPSVPVIAHIRKEDAVSGHVPFIEFPPRSLFAKPARGSVGRGVLAWEYDGAGFYIDKDDNRLTVDQLRDTLTRLSRVESYIVQPKLMNHPSIADLSLGGLCTARIVTSRLPGLPPSLVLAAFKMPGGRAVADNFSHGGVACSIDHRPNAAGLGTGGNDQPQGPRGTGRLPGHRMGRRIYPRWPGPDRRERAPWVRAFPDTDQHPAGGYRSCCGDPEFRRTEVRMMLRRESLEDGRELVIREAVPADAAMVVDYCEDVAIGLEL